MGEGNTGWVPLEKGEQTVKLDECPFCHSGSTGFLKSRGHQMLMIAHRPAAGVVCPARYEQYCDSQDQGASFWNCRGKDKDEKGQGEETGHRGPG